MHFSDVLGHLVILDSPLSKHEFLIWIPHLSWGLCAVGAVQMFVVESAWRSYRKSVLTARACQGTSIKEESDLFADFLRCSEAMECWVNFEAGMITTLYLPSCSPPSFILSRLKSIIHTLNDLVLPGEPWLLIDGSASKDTSAKLDLEQIQETLLIDSLF